MRVGVHWRNGRYFPCSETREGGRHADEGVHLSDQSKPQFLDEVERILSDLAINQTSVQPQSPELSPDPNL